MQALHDGITDGVYATIGTVARTTGRVAAVGADWPGERTPSETPRGAVLIGVVLGLIGDDLEAQGSPLAADPVTVRVDGAIVHLGEGPVPAGRLDPRRCSTVPPAAWWCCCTGSRETEHAWGVGGLDADDYGVRLAVDLGRRRCTCGTTAAATSATPGATWPTSWSDWSRRGPCRSPTSR